MAKLVTIILLSLLFVSCNNIQNIGNTMTKSTSIDGEYYMPNAKGVVGRSGQRPYFLISKGYFLYYPAGDVGDPARPIKGNMMKLADDCYLFNSEFQNSRFNYERKKIEDVSDSVIIDIRFFSGLPMSDSHLSVILRNRDTIPVADLIDRKQKIRLDGRGTTSIMDSNTVLQPIRVSCAFANQIEWLCHEFFLWWKVDDFIPKFECGNRYSITLMDEEYFVIKNEKIKITDDTLFRKVIFERDTFDAPYVRINFQ